MNTKHTTAVLRRSFYLFLFSVIISACNPEAQGFVLPEGDAEAGKMSFRNLECNQCHSMAAIPWQRDSLDTHIVLGGETTTIKTYGELVTSIINPSHDIARRYLANKGMVDSLGHSKMTVYNEVMTVQELIDIVAFLKGAYHVTTPPMPYYY
jgi:hypothetical protein